MTATERYDFILSGVLRVVYYRSLHMVSVPFSIQEVATYALEQTQAGRFGGTLQPVKQGRFIHAYLWRNIRFGEDLTADVWILGGHNGRQTLLVRRGFWRGNFTPSTTDPSGFAAPRETPR